jgi:hypothetical protein
LRIYHESLREHLQHAPDLAITRRDTIDNILCKGAQDPGQGPAAHYLYRNGVRHLVEAYRWEDAAAVIVDPHKINQRTTYLGQHSYAFGLSLTPHEPVIGEYELIRGRLDPSHVEIFDSRFWSAYLHVIDLDKMGGVWLRTLLKNYSIPTAVFDLLARNPECQSVFLRAVESLLSGFGWQAELGATNPVHAVTSFIRAAGRAEQKVFLDRIRNAKTGPWIALVHEKPGPAENVTNTLWEQDMRTIYYSIQDALGESSSE